MYLSIGILIVSLQNFMRLLIVLFLIGIFYNLVSSKVGRRPTTLDWNYYASSYPLNLRNEQDAKNHWRRHGYREGRIGAREILKDKIENNLQLGSMGNYFEDA